MKKKVISYARFSPRPKEEENENGETPICDSNIKQFERIRDYCNAFGYEIVAEYQDEYLSGGSLDGRDGLEAAIRHAMKIRGVLACYDVSRLSRDAADGNAILKRLNSRKVELLVIVERIDTTYPAGRLLFTLLLGVSQFVREENSDRTSRAMLKHLLRGRRMCRQDRVPFGWRVGSDPAKLEKDEAEQSLIVEMVRLAAEGKSARGICKALDDSNLPRRGGKKWYGAHGLVAKILAKALK